MKAYSSEEAYITFHAKGASDVTMFGKQAIKFASEYLSTMVLGI